MSYWWDPDPSERYWCEITDRPDPGTDLKCPQISAHLLIHEIELGDIVFHYQTGHEAFIGASVVGGIVEERPIVWSAHSSNEEPKLQPGWWLPLYSYKSCCPLLTRDYLNSPKEKQWIFDWISMKEAAVGPPVYAPFQRRDPIRAAQKYLTKMPRGFVERWAQLGELAETLSGIQEKVQLGVSASPANAASLAKLQFKSDSDYFVALTGGIQKRTRTHETLVRNVGELLRSVGVEVSTPHPIDLYASSPAKVMFEAKPIPNSGPLYAVREAVGQLLEYRYFLGPKDAIPCILLNGDPGDPLAEYVEEVIGFGICWFTDGRLWAGSKTCELLNGFPVNKNTEMPRQLDD